MGPYLNCITRYLCWLHRTSSVSSSIWTSQADIQYNGLFRRRGRQHKLSHAGSVKYMKIHGKALGPSCITIAAVLGAHSMNELLSLWDEAAGLSSTFRGRRRHEEVTVQRKNKEILVKDEVPLWFRWLCLGFPFLRPAATLRGENERRKGGY